MAGASRPERQLWPPLPQRCPFRPRCPACSLAGWRPMPRPPRPVAPAGWRSASSASRRPPIPSPAIAHPIAAQYGGSEVRGTATSMPMPAPMRATAVAVRRGRWPPRSLWHVPGCTAVVASRVEYSPGQRRSRSAPADEPRRPPAPRVACPHHARIRGLGGRLDPDDATGPGPCWPKFVTPRPGVRGMAQKPGAQRFG
jgi:hypothetical protein